MFCLVTDGLIDQKKRKHVEARCVTEVRLRFWKAFRSATFTTRQTLLYSFPDKSMRFFLSTTTDRFFSPDSSRIVCPRYQSRERVSGGGDVRVSLRKCHEILVGPPSQSRRILHAPFVAMSRIINRKIALIFSSLRFVRATAIAEASRSLMS